MPMEIAWAAANPNMSPALYIAGWSFVFSLGCGYIKGKWREEAKTLGLQFFVLASSTFLCFLYKCHTCHLREEELMLTVIQRNYPVKTTTTMLVTNDSLSFLLLTLQFMFGFVRKFNCFMKQTALWVQTVTFSVPMERLPWALENNSVQAP